jgi:hypothetical protein
LGLAADAREIEERYFHLADSSTDNCCSGFFIKSLAAGQLQPTTAHFQKPIFILVGRLRSHEVEGEINPLR